MSAGSEESSDWDSVRDSQDDGRFDEMDDDAMESYFIRMSEQD